MFRTIGVFLVSLWLFAAPEATSGQTPAKLELAQNWKLVAAQDVPADGGALSQPAYDDRKWLPIHRMPATVLEILQEDGVYPVSGRKAERSRTDQPQRLREISLLPPFARSAFRD
jgi:exo-1,4-beta-D-glucosaminidase